MAENRTLVRLLLRPYAGGLLLAAVVSLVAAGAALVQPLALQNLLETIDAADEAHVRTALVMLISATALEALAIGVQTHLLYRIGANAVARTRSTLISCLLRWPLGRYSTVGRGTMSTIVTGDTAAMHPLIAAGVFEVFTALVMTVGAVVFMYTISWSLTLVTLAVVVMAAVVVSVATQAVRRDSRQAQMHSAAMADQLDATLGAVRTFRASGAMISRERAIEHEVEQSRAASLRVGRRMSWVVPLSNIVVQAAFVAVLGFGGVMTYTGDITLAEMMAFLMYLMITLMPIENGLSVLPVLQKSLGSWDRIRGLLDGDDSTRHLASSAPLGLEKPGASADRTHQAASPARDVDTSPLIRRPPQITLEGIGHAFGSEPVLEHLQETFPAGSVTALWGPSGTGKSTLMDILAGLITPTHGRLCFDGDHRSHEGRSSYLEQRAPVVRGTLRDNLRLGSTDVTDPEMLHVLQRVGLEHLLKRNGDGLDAAVGEDGLELSGGEGQRLALARLLLRPEPLVLLDEPTSRVDVATERLIHDAINELRGKHTIVIATHRQTTRALCDHVVEFRSPEPDDPLSLSSTHP